VKTLSAVILFIVTAGATPAHALFGDEAILSMQYAEDKTYHTFMQLQLVQEIATLKANYDASVRYYKEFNQLNSGPGFLKNIEHRIKVAQQQENQKIQQDLKKHFNNPSPDNNTGTDEFFKSIDHSIAGNIQYAGDEMANLISNRQVGVDAAQSADGLSPKDAANLTARTQGLQLQMMASLHEDNLRMLQLQSLMLSRQTRREEEETSVIQTIKQSLQSRGFANVGMGVSQ